MNGIEISKPIPSSAASHIPDTNVDEIADPIPMPIRDADTLELSVEEK